MKILYGYLRNYRGLIALALALATINQVFSLLDPLIFRHVIDEYATRFQEYSTGEFFRGVSLLLGAAVGVAFVSRVAKNFQDYYINVITQRLGAELYSDGIRHSLELPYSVFEDQRSGETLGRLQKVRTDVEKPDRDRINVLFTSLVGIVFVMIYAFSVHWVIAPAYFLTVPILGVLSSVLSRRIKQIQKVIVAETTALAGSTTESLRNIELVKSLGLGQQEIARLNGTTAQDPEARAEEGAVPAQPQLHPGHGGEPAAHEHHVPDALPDLHARRSRSASSSRCSSTRSSSSGRCRSSGTSSTSIARPKRRSTSTRRSCRSPRRRGPRIRARSQDLRTLAFERVTFQHQSASSPAVSDISFQIARGETIAFVGPSGAGKTTLVKLLVGLYQPLSGQILYNGIPGRRDRSRTTCARGSGSSRRTRSSSRERFARTCCSSTRRRPMPSASRCCDRRRATACWRARIAGSTRVIGEGGVKVSGGEKQRLSIARALLRRPHLLVFDEATSSLDSLTEEGIIETMRDVAASGDAMTVLIAHRLSTILHADRIYVLERGRIVETGGHQQLLDQKGLYYAMWRQQIGERRGGESVAAGLLAAAT